MNKNIKKLSKVQICNILRNIFEELAEERIIYTSCSLEHYCGVCSWYLRQYFKKYGYSAECVYAEGFENHCWVESEGYIYDLTATQFWSCEPVFIRQISEAKKFSPVYRGRREIVTSVKDFDDWPEDERPCARYDSLIAHRFKKYIKNSPVHYS